MRRATAVALLLAVPAAVPLAWLLVASLDGGGRAYGHLFATQPVGRWLANSLLIAAGQTVVAAALCGSAGFALAAYDFRGRRTAIGLLVVTALLPGPVAVPGLFAATASLGGVNTYWAATLPGAFSVFGVFLFAAAFRSVPRSLLEAGRLDGCSEPRVFLSIAWPTVRPTAAAFSLLHFLSAWNALVWPAAVLVDEDRQTLAVALSNLARRVDYEADPALLAAAVAVSVLPVMLLFWLCGREFAGAEPEDREGAKGSRRVGFSPPSGGRQMVG